MKKDKAWMILPMLAYTKYINGDREITIGWLRKCYWIKF